MTNTRTSIAQSSSKRPISPIELLAAIGKWASDNRDQILAMKAFYVDSICEIESDHAALVDANAIRTLMQFGWFPDFDIAPMELRLLANAFEHGPDQSQFAHSELCTRFRERLAPIESKLTRAYPHRSAIIRDGFSAHRSNQWNLSVIAFLTQVDGIFFDSWSTNLFRGGEREKLRALIGEMSDELGRTLTSALLNEGWPLTLSSSKRPSNSPHLNRHQVLHGEVTDYGTEENSLKAISLLNYTAFATRSVSSGAQS